MRFQAANLYASASAEFLAVETYDSLQKVGDRYFFRKRLPDQEQPCIYMRDGADGEDHLLIDPRERGTGEYTAVKPLRVSPDGRLLLYEVKEGGERTGTFELLDIDNPETSSRFSPSRVFTRIRFRAGRQKFLLRSRSSGRQTAFLSRRIPTYSWNAPSEDQEIFFAGEDEKIRLGLFSKANVLSSSYIDFLKKHSRISI